LVVSSLNVILNCFYLFYFRSYCSSTGRNFP